MESGRLIDEPSEEGGFPKSRDGDTSVVSLQSKLSNQNGRVNAELGFYLQGMKWKS